MLIGFYINNDTVLISVGIKTHFNTEATIIISIFSFPSP